MMKQQSALLLALVGALLVASSAAGPIRPVGGEGENKYVFVKLLFQGHDQPNFDKWHANATAATVAEAAGVPVNYLIRLVDGKVPGTKETAPTKKKQEPAFVPAPAPVEPTPAEKPVVAPTPTAAPQAPAVSLITSPTAEAKPAQPEQQQQALKTNPESSPSELSVPAQTQQPEQQQQQQQQSEQQQQQPEQQQEAQQQQQEEPTETPVAPAPRRSRRPRVFIIRNGRKLMRANQEPNQALVEYAIRTNASEPWAVRETVQRKLMASAAGFGMAQGTSQHGFYTLLKEHGVGYFPSMWIDGEQILSGQVAMEAPPNRFVNGTHKNFQHKLYKHTDLVKDAAPKNATNVTVSEPAFIMANRSIKTDATTTITAAAPKQSGLAPWAAALIALGAIAVATALIATVWRCAKERRARKAEEEAAHSEPLSPTPWHHTCRDVTE